MENAKIELPGLIEDNSKRPAYPTSYAYDSDDGITRVTHFGLTKREYIAAMCLQGILANGVTFQISSDRIDPNEFPELYATVALEHADELLKQLGK